MDSIRSLAVRLASAPHHLMASMLGAFGSISALIHRQRVPSTQAAYPNPEAGHTYNSSSQYELNPKPGAHVEEHRVSDHSDETGFVTIDIPGANITPAAVSKKPYSLTKRGLKNRHAHMIALGGTIGTVFFMSIADLLTSSGPAILVASFATVSILSFFVLTAIVEMAAYLPVHGGTMNYFAYRYVSRSMGFAMGYMYWSGLSIAAVHQIAESVLILCAYWHLHHKAAVACITSMIIVLVVLNSLPVRVFGVTEYWFTWLKCGLLAILIITSMVIFCGGGPDQHGFLGFRYWRDPGPVVTDTTTFINWKAALFLIIFGSLFIATFPFQFAAELVVMTAGEMEKPRQNLEKASMLYFYRLIIFYILAVVCLSVIVPSDYLAHHPYGPLVAGTIGPWVEAFRDAGFPALGSFLSVAIVAVATSSANSYLYISSRSLYSLSVVGSAPQIFRRCSADGVPYFAVMASLAFLPLTYMCQSSASNQAIPWLHIITMDWTLISLICCCIVYLRFRKAVDAQQVTRMPFRSKLQPWGVWIALCLFSLLLMFSGLIAFWPWTGIASLSDIVSSYAGLSIFALLYAGHRLRFREDKWVREPMEVDLWTGLVEVEAAEGSREEMEAWFERSKKES